MGRLYQLTNAQQIGLRTNVLGPMADRYFEFCGKFDWYYVRQQDDGLGPKEAANQAFKLALRDLGTLPDDAFTATSPAQASPDGPATPSGDALLKELLAKRKGNLATDVQWVGDVMGIDNITPTMAPSPFAYTLYRRCQDDKQFADKIFFPVLLPKVIPSRARIQDDEDDKASADYLEKKIQSWEQSAKEIAAEFKELDCVPDEDTEEAPVEEAV